MENLILIGTVVFIHFLALVSPGPDFIMTVKNSLTYSRSTGIWTSVGFGLSTAVHILYCAAGLALIISQSIIIFTLIKFLGVGYLIYIGLQAFFSKQKNIEIKSSDHKKDISIFKAIQIGFFTNLLNPKATLFFLSLFTLVVSPQTPVFVLWIISTMMVINIILWFSLVSIFLTQQKVRNTFNKFQTVFNKIFGSLLIGLGIKIALD